MIFFMFWLLVNWGIGCVVKRGHFFFNVLRLIRHALPQLARVDDLCIKVNFDRNQTTFIMEEMMYKHDHSGQRSTAIGLAAGLGGGALLLAIAGLWGVNKASEARAAGANQGLAGIAGAMAALNGNVNANRTAIESALANERISREGWQTANTPSIQSYIDVQATPSQTTTASAAATAAAYAQMYNPMNAAIGTDSFLKVQRYSAPVPCGCDSCSCNG